MHDWVVPVGQLIGLILLGVVTWFTAARIDNNPELGWPGFRAKLQKLFRRKARKQEPAKPIGYVTQIEKDATGLSVKGVITDERVYKLIQEAKYPHFFSIAGDGSQATFVEKDEDEMPEDCEPNLGCATTRQLLEELKARGETEVYYTELGNDMAIGAQSLIDSFPGSMLNYRTIDN